MLDKLGRLLLDSFTQPKDAAEGVLSLDLRQEALVLGAGAISAITGILFAAFFSAIPTVPEMQAMNTPSPIGTAVNNLLMIFVLSWALFLVGRSLGGVGAFLGSATVVVWLSLVQVGVLALSAVVMALIPTLGLLVFVALGFWLLWINATFVATLHGFQNTWLVLFGVVGVQLVLLVVMSMFTSAILGSN